MSHFTVVVIGNDVDEQLFPYDESLSVPKYSRGIVSQNELDNFVDYYRRNKSEDISELSLDELYSLFGKDWNNNEWEKNEDGVYEEFSTYNPNSKWDWYVVGGRWTGYFKLKPGSEGMTGEPGVFGSKPEPGTADIVLKKDIDFEFVRNKASETAAKKYDIFQEYIKDTPQHESWESVRSRFEDINDARSFYHKQPRIVAFNDLCKTSDLFSGFDNIENYEIDRDTFITRARNNSISPYAIVHDAVWYQKGEMGWWGMTSNEMSDDEWNAKVQELFDSVSDDTLFTLVDCHI